MIKEFRGFNRILTIIARGYMWKTDEPDVDRAYRALCAWCSLPESVKPDSGLDDSLGRFGHRQFFGGGKNPAAFTVHFKFLPIVRIFLPSLYS